MTKVESTQWIKPFQYDALKSAKELATKETSDNCAIAAFQRTAYVAGAVVVAVAQIFLDACRATANAFIYLANATHSYFANKEVVEDIEEGKTSGSGTMEGSSATTPEDPAKGSATGAPTTIINPIIDPPTPEEKPLIILQQPKTRTQRTAELLKATGNFLYNSTGTFLSTVTYPIVHPINSAKALYNGVGTVLSTGTYPIVHPINSAKAVGHKMSDFGNYVAETRAWKAGVNLLDKADRYFHGVEPKPAESTKTEETPAAPVETPKETAQQTA